MHHALSTPFKGYETAGVKSDGEYQQLNANLIQIENEFYGTIRPKRTAKSGQRPLTALTQEGVEYVEVRCLDLNPFLPVGIDTTQIKFLDTFLLHCLFSSSSNDSPEESHEMQANQLMVVERGRQQGISLSKNGEQKSLHIWAAQLINECKDIARVLDTDSGDYLAAANAQHEKTGRPFINAFCANPLRYGVGKYYLFGICPQTIDSSQGQFRQVWLGRRHPAENGTISRKLAGSTKRNRGP